MTLPPGPIFRKQLGCGSRRHRVYGATYGHLSRRSVVALPPEETIPNSQKDRNANLLTANTIVSVLMPANAACKCVLVVNPGDEKGFGENPIHRYTIGDSDDLKYNHDGSLDIFIQHDRPAEGDSNWLPAYEGTFEVSMRLYMPKPSFLNGEWKLPAIERVDDR
jgi:hypothetical protein